MKQAKRILLKCSKTGLDTGIRGVQFELDHKESLTSLISVIC